LQLTFTVVAAGGAVPAVIRQQEFQNILAVAAQALGVGLDHHARFRRRGAGGL